MDQQRPSIGHLWRLVRLVAPHWGRFSLATVALLGGSAVGLAYPQALRYAVDHGLVEESLARLDLVFAVMLGVFALDASLTWIRHYLMSWLGERAVADLRSMVFDHLVRLPVSWFHERRSGELVGRLSADVTVVQGVVGSELSVAMRSGITLAGGVVLLFVENARLTLMMLAIVPPLVVAAVIFGRRINKMSTEVQDRLAAASAEVQESIGAIQTVQGFVREEEQGRVYRRGVGEVFAAALRLARWRASFMSSTELGGSLAIAAIVWMGARAVMAGEISPGDLAAFLLYTTIVAFSLGMFASLWGSLQRAAGATARLFDILDTVPAIADPPDPVPLPEGGGAVRFDGVDFVYESRQDHPVLSSIELSIAPGEVVALVGPSGAGKSTLTSLLLRFHDVTRGQVSFEGIDVRRLRLAELRRAMAMVAQEPVLFSGTIHDNIAYARPGASRSEVESAARDAHAHEFITRFPDEYETLVGERGVKLSGGQKQRIAIARAILADPRVLILDEATSNLDAESEALVQEALSRLMKGRTTLVIAHRLSTVRDADRIVVLNHGRVVEQGTHEALMGARGVYHRLVEHQLIEA